MTRMLVLALSARIGLCSVVSEFLEVAKELGPSVRAVGCVGPLLRMENGADAIRQGLGAPPDKTVVALSSDLVLIEARDCDTSDPRRISDDAASAMCGGDVLVYAVKAHDVRARGERKAQYLSGLVAGLERSSQSSWSKKVVVAVEGLDKEVEDLVSDDLSLVDLADVKIVDAMDSEALKAAVFGGQQGDGRSPEAVARSLSSPRKRSSLSPSAGNVAKRAAEVAALKACSAAFDALEIEEAVALLAARWQLDSKFSIDYQDHAASLVDDILVKFDKLVDQDVFDTDAYSRKRAEAAIAASSALDAAFFETQLTLLAQDTAQHLRSGLKGLRVTKAVKPQTNALLKDAANYFETKAHSAFGPSKTAGGRHWKARKNSVLDALSDYIDERLQVARLQGTYVPDAQLFKWPFPVAFSFHWLVPAALGRVETQQRGLSLRDKQLFDIKDQADAPRFPIPAAVQKFSKNLVTSNTNAPVE